MNVLLALVAFSVVMIVMSTIVTALVQILYRARSIRERHLRFFLRTYFDQVLWPRFQAEISALNAYDGKPKLLGPEARTVAAQLYGSILKIQREFKTRGKSNWFWTGLTVVSLIVLWLAFSVDSVLGVLVAAIGFYIALGTHLTAKERVLVTSNREDIREKFVRAMSASVGTAQEGNGKADSIDAVEFAGRLAETDIGKALAARGKDKIDALITDLMRRYDSHGQGASAGFKSLSQRYAVRIAFVVAIVANVDAVTVLRHFIDNPTLSENVAAMGPDVIAEHEKQAQAFEDRQRKIEAELNDRKSPPTEDQSKKLQQELKDLKGQIDKFQKEFHDQVAKLAKAGVPIGWERYPYCVVEGYPSDPRCARLLSAEARDAADRKPGGKGRNEHPGLAKFETALAGLIPGQLASAVEEGWDWIRIRWAQSPGDFLGWLAGVTIAGALIGLGGPFWFDFYRRLSAVTQLAKSFGFKATPKQDDAAGGANAKPEKPDDVHKPVSAVDAFKKAVEADRIYEETQPAIRRPLAPDGSTERL